MLNATSAIVSESLSTVPNRLALGASGAGRRAQDGLKWRDRARTWRRPEVLDQGLFLEALRRERRRADRFDHPFTLLLVRLRGVSADAQPTWAPIVGALAAAKRDTDLLGWYEGGLVLGLILPEVNPAERDVPAEICRRVRREIAGRMDREGAANVSIEIHPHSGLTALEWRSTALRTMLKRALDIVGSLALLLMVAPVLFVVAALVKLTSSGPVFFRQQRVGEAAAPFMMLKFRTMRVDADESIHQEYVRQFITANAAAAASTNGAVFKITNDPRVTPVGRFLRRTSLDELPQLWNVVRGEMSLVGPRPPLPYEVAQYKPWHRRRVLEAKPGITGLWQVTGRSRTTFDDMVRLDLRYARMHSVWTDIRILLATPRAVITGKGAC